MTLQYLCNAKLETPIVNQCRKRIENFYNVVASTIIVVIIVEKTRYQLPKAIFASNQFQADNLLNASWRCSRYRMCDIIKACKVCGRSPREHLFLAKTCCLQVAHEVTNIVFVEL